ncbi:MAG: D-glycero-beta-D-manno-heptose 1-phosphate adenylyltransferase [Desulfomonile tiedjei]|uniref:Bifunctional protein HldE n=1 Tax=Desulfomonile tiedjei TaxID=2358 RepID=A0A9D6V2W6_9BACT|nr:D-glycero-beta-D-manno-heptose 1-phosphate adenylyltransferase [Desulfomonile tiedjei]
MNEILIRKVKPAPVLVAGDVMVDEYVLGDVERISPESPVPVLVARDRLRKLGGAGNVVQNIVTMGGQVALFATVGKDNPGSWFKEYCENIGVESFWIKEDPARPTTIKTRVVARNQQIVRIDQEQVGALPPEIEALIVEEIKSVMPQVKAAVVSDYGKGFLTARVLDTIMSSARAHHIPVVVDPKGLDFRRYRGATYVTPNLKEASMASGVEIHNHESLVKAGRVLLDQTEVESVIVTRGREGSTLVTRNKSQDFPARQVEIVDVTGAGDTVIAALALAVANNLPIESAAELANLAASLVVARFGAASVTLDEMIDSLNEDLRDNKFVSIEDIASVLRNHRIAGHRIVFTNGCFDLFHSGHLDLLRQASAQGEVTVVGVNSDQSVRRLKGAGRPIIPLANRVAVISALSCVDYVVAFTEDTPLNLIKTVSPDVLVKGEDWKDKQVVGADIVKARGGRVEFAKLVPGISTTLLIKKIRDAS